MLLGCLAYGASTSLFLQPSSIVAGGVSGFAVMLNLLFEKLPVGMMIIALNIPILIAGLKMQGLKFIFRALITIVTLGIVTDLIGTLGTLFLWGSATTLVLALTCFKREE